MRTEAGIGELLHLLERWGTSGQLPAEGQLSTSAQAKGCLGCCAFGSNSHGLECTSPSSVCVTLSLIYDVVG